MVPELQPAGATAGHGDHLDTPKNSSRGTVYEASGRSAAVEGSINCVAASPESAAPPARLYNRDSSTDRSYQTASQNGSPSNAMPTHCTDGELFIVASDQPRTALCHSVAEAPTVAPLEVKPKRASPSAAATTANRGILSSRDTPATMEAELLLSFSTSAERVSKYIQTPPVSATTDANTIAIRIPRQPAAVNLQQESFAISSSSSATAKTAGSNRPAPDTPPSRDTSTGESFAPFPPRSASVPPEGTAGQTPSCSSAKGASSRLLTSGGSMIMAGLCRLICPRASLSTGVLRAGASSIPPPRDPLSLLSVRTDPGRWSGLGLARARALADNCPPPPGADSRPLEASAGSRLGSVCSLPTLGKSCGGVRTIPCGGVRTPGGDGVCNWP
eukprot:Hpha_TRINITY_DN16192_c0_g13::TRINITY_DN16192_c0_g13_i1::g.7775::m.7775